MVLHVEPGDAGQPDPRAVEETLREVTKLGGSVQPAARGSLPNDGKVIADERDYSS
jgi:phenylacetate-CoA ligase